MQAASELGISQTFLSAIERDSQVPGGDIILAFKRVYDISADWLLSGELPVVTSDALLSGKGAEGYIIGADPERLRELEVKVASLEEELRQVKAKAEAYRELILAMKAPIP